MINIREKTADFLQEKQGIPKDKTEAMFDSHILNENYCRRVLVAHEYKKRSTSSMSKTDIKVLLSDRYCISYSTVEKYIFQILNGSADT